MASTELHALDHATTAPSEGFWRRDEVVYLLHAWRDVAADHVSSSAFHPDDDPAYQQRIFERFCGFYDTGGDDRLPPRSFKSLMKTKKSLLRSYRFIAMFNQNHVIARSMSALGGSNWFALPDDEQRRVVSAHYKRKPFAYIDEDMFDAIAMIQDMEAQQTQAQEQQGDDDIPLDVLPPHLQQQHNGVKDDYYYDDDAPSRALPSSRSVGRFSRAMRQRATSTPAASPRPVDSETQASGSRFGASWTPEDHTMLLQAWEEVLTEPRTLDEPMAVLDRRVYDRFQALTGGGNAQRSLLAVRLKRYSLMSTYEFIQAFDRDEIVTRPHGLAWFDTTRKYRAGIVQQHYKKSHFAHIDADMVATLGRIANHTRTSEQRKASSSGAAVAAAMALAASIASPRLVRQPTGPASSLYEDNDSGEDVRTEPPTYTDEDDDNEVAHEPWGRHETSLLVNAWSQAETLVQQDPSTRDAVDDLDALIYTRFCANCGGESLRARADVAAKTRALEHTFELITAFNHDASMRTSNDDDDSDAPVNWFALRKGERDRHIRDAPHECVDIDEGTFNELRWIFQVRKQAALLSTLTTPVPVPVTRPATPQSHALTPVASAGGHGHARAVTVWGRDEVLHLLHAWQDILDGPCPPNESLVALNDRIYSRFVVLIGGTTIRTVKALHAKRDSVVMSYHFIQDFNRGKFASPPPNVGDAWSATDWFALAHDEQKLAVKLYFRKVSFSYLYVDMLPAVAKIIDMSPKATTSTATSATAATTAAAPETVDSTLVQQRKPRPNSWMPDELRSFLRAWYEAVVEHPREATETASAFNSRLHRRFVELCGGRSKKAEVSLLTKRRVLTTTYEFIAEFNRRAMDEHELDWFRISDAERKKRMILANKVVFTVTNIDEETFLALEQILGGEVDDDDRQHAADRPSSFWSVTGASHEDEAKDTTRGIASPTATLYDSVRVFIGAKRKAPTATRGSVKRQRVSETSKALRPSIASPTATLYDSVRAFIGAKRPPSRSLPPPPPVAVSYDRPLLRSKIETRARRRDLLIATTVSEPLESRRPSSADSASDSVRKKQRVTETHREPESRHLIAITRMFEKQTEHFASMIDAIKAERKTEQDERRELLDAILNDQLEERRRVREEQAAERELVKQRWQEFRDERKADREQDRFLLAQVLKLHTGTSNS